MSWPFNLNVAAAMRASVAETVAMPAAALITPVTAVAPQFPGQLMKTTAHGVRVWVATGLRDTDWLQIAGAPPPDPWPILAVAPASPEYSALPEPAYLSSVIDPRTSSFSIPTKLTRVSPNVSDGLWTAKPPYSEATHGNLNYGPVYAKQSPWNSDGSRLLCWDQGRASGQHLLDGSTYAYIRPVSGVSSHYRWFRSDPDRLAYIETSPVLRSYTVSSNALGVLKDFSPLGYVEQAFGFGAGEGNQSSDDRYWPLCLRHSANGWRLIVWDRVADSIICNLPLPNQWAAIGDWFGMSQSGEFLVTVTLSAWSAGEVGVPVGMNIWSRTGTLLRTRYNGAARSVMNHCDLGIDSDGFDVVVYIGPENDGTANDKFLVTWRLNGSDGSTTRRQMSAGPIKTVWHISAQAPGWAVVSTFPFGDPAVTTIAVGSALHNHITAVRLNGGGQAAVVANSRHTNETIANYYPQSTFACPNRQMTKIAFHSAFEYGGGVPSRSHMVIAERGD